MSLLEKMRGDKKGWYKVSDLRPGVEIAVPSEKGQAIWDEIVSITPVDREHVYDIEVEGTHNFVGNGIFAHNTYVLRANTMLAVEGVVVPMPTLPVSDGLPSATTTSQIPSSVLTADGLGVDLYKLSTYNLAASAALAARMDATDVRVTSLESRVEKLESGAVSSATGSPFSLGSSTLASALESLGAFISKGIAQFGTLVADRFVAATNSAGTSSAGTVTILAGNTVAQVTNAYVLPTSKIFVTLTASTTGSWYISDKQAGSFKLVLSAAQAADVTFDYFIVQTTGQLATSSPEVIGNREQGVVDSTTTYNLQPTTSGADTTGPVMTLLGDNPVHLSVGGTFVEPGVTAVDNVDGAIPQTSLTTFVNGIEGEASAATIDTGSETTYIITYKASDRAGNFSTVTRAVIVGGGSVVGADTSDDSVQHSVLDTSEATTTSATVDTVAPIIALLGEAAIQITVGDPFLDPGATATDETDGDLASSIVVTGTVDTATAGLYTLTYTVLDAGGNAATVSRVVTMAAAPVPETIPDTTTPEVAPDAAAPPASPQATQGTAAAAGETATSTPQ